MTLFSWTHGGADGAGTAAAANGSPSPSGTTTTSSTATSSSANTNSRTDAYPPVTTTGSFVAAAAAACFAVTFTNPCECVKTRLQLQGELARSISTTSATTSTTATATTVKPYSNAFTALAHIWRTEGYEGVQKGLRVAYVYQILMNGTRLGIYGAVKDTTSSAFDLILGKQASTDGRPRWIVMPVAGALCGVVGAMVSSPLYLVKTRMQSYTGAKPYATTSITGTNLSKVVSVGDQHSYVTKGVIHSLKTIYKNEGIRGLWRGVDASILRTSIGSAIQLSTYDTFKAMLKNSGLFSSNDDNDNATGLYFASSLLTSFLVVLTMNPFDVATTRMYNQHASSAGGGSKYSSALDCIVKTIKSEGVLALYKGMGAHYLRMGPHTILFLVMYEQLRSVVSKAEDRFGIEHHLT